jgi:LCP family protein required for cell wall assembly
VLILVLALLAVVVPDAGRHPTSAALVEVEGASGLDTEPGVVWILALGSDARVDQPVLRSRSDAIQLVGLNARTGDATVIGIPRDSYTYIPGHGTDKINVAMEYGGPQLAARTVARLTRITPDFVFATSFVGFKRMIRAIGGVTVRSRYQFSTPKVRIRRGVNRLDPLESLTFVRERYALPNGDFDRSRNQSRFLIDTLGTMRLLADRHGGVEQALAAFLRHTDVDVGPVALYRLAHAVIEVKPSAVTACLLRGSVGMAGSASVVFPDVAYARSLAARARADARLEGGC